LDSSKVHAGFGACRKIRKLKGLRMRVPSKLIRKLIKKTKKKRFKKISMEYSLFLKG